MKLIIEDQTIIFHSTVRVQINDEVHDTAKWMSFDYEDIQNMQTVDFDFFEKYRQLILDSAVFLFEKRTQNWFFEDIEE